MNERQSLQRIMDAIDDEVARNYHNYDSAFGADDSHNYDSALDYDGESILNMVGDGQAKGLSNYSCNVVYVDNSSSGANVEVEFFGTDFNNGVITGSSLVFTNNFGDTGTITGNTANFVAFQNQIRYAPLRVAYFRMNPQTSAQFNTVLTFRKDSVLGGFKGNTLTPNDFLTPEQFQLLRVDVPVNAPFNGERRMIMQLLATETTPGTNMIFWISQLEQNIRRLQGKNSVIQMNAPGIQNTGPSIPTAQALTQTLEAMKQNIQLDRGRFNLRLPNQR